MSLATPRQKILMLPVIRGIYDPSLTQSVKAAMRAAVADLKLDAIFPPADEVIRSDADVRRYYETWRGELWNIRALIVFSGDFTAERAIQDTVRLLPTDVPMFLMVNNDKPAEMGQRTVGDSLCGVLAAHHNLRLLGRRLVRSCAINMHDPATLQGFLRQYATIAAGIESLRNMRIGLFGVNPDPFATTFSNQAKLFELGFSLHTYELLQMWADTMLAPLAEDDAATYCGPFGEVRFWRPIRKSDPRVAAAKKLAAETFATLPADAAKLETTARCLAWLQETYAQDRLDTGAIHCWSEFGRCFGISPCGFAMLSNWAMRRPLACEVDIGHAIMMKLAADLTGEAGVILDVNNNGWEPRVFNVFHCSQTPANWIAGPAKLNNYGGVEGVMAAVPFTAISAATSSDAFHATVFQGQFLPDHPGRRGVSGWAFVPNFPEVLKQIQATGIHHFVALKGHLGADVAEVLRFRGLTVRDLSVPVGSVEEIRREVPKLEQVGAGCCPVFAQ